MTSLDPIGSAAGSVGTKLPKAKGNKRNQKLHEAAKTCLGESSYAKNVSTHTISGHTFTVVRDFHKVEGFIKLKDYLERCAASGSVTVYMERSLRDDNRKLTVLDGMPTSDTRGLEDTFLYGLESLMPILSGYNVNRVVGAMMNSDSLVQRRIGEFYTSLRYCASVKKVWLGAGPVFRKERLIQRFEEINKTYLTDKKLENRSSQRIARDLDMAYIGPLMRIYIEAGIKEYESQYPQLSKMVNEGLKATSVTPPSSAFYASFETEIQRVREDNAARNFVKDLPEVAATGKPIWLNMGEAHVEGFLRNVKQLLETPSKAKEDGKEDHEGDHKDNAPSRNAGSA